MDDLKKKPAKLQRVEETGLPLLPVISESLESQYKASPLQSGKADLSMNMDPNPNNPNNPDIMEDTNMPSRVNIRRSKRIIKVPEKLNL